MNGVLEELERLKRVMDGAEGVEYARARVELAEAMVKRAGGIIGVLRAAERYHVVMTGPVDARHCEVLERQGALGEAIAGLVELQRAKIGMTYGAETQNIAERDLDAALSALDVKGGG